KDGQLVIVQVRAVRFADTQHHAVQVVSFGHECPYRYICKCLCSLHTGRPANSTEGSRRSRNVGISIQEHPGAEAAHGITGHINAAWIDKPVGYPLIDDTHHIMDFIHASIYIPWSK